MSQRFVYWFSEPKRGDIVVFRTRGIEGTRGDFYAMRVVGLPGERINVQEGRLWVNGQPVLEPKIFKELSYVHLHGARHLTDSNDIYQVPAGHYFVLGDNSEHSADSRYWGPVPRANIYAKVTKIYLPQEREGVPE